MIYKDYIQLQVVAEQHLQLNRALKKDGEGRDCRLDFVTLYDFTYTRHEVCVIDPQTKQQNGLPLYLESKACFAIGQYN